jgi:hypothetical protein
MDEDNNNDDDGYDMAPSQTIIYHFCINEEPDLLAFPGIPFKYGSKDTCQCRL